MVMNKIKQIFWTFIYNYRYSFVDTNLCCCGSNNCSGGMSHSFRSAREYAVTCAVEKKLKEK